jgi:hypothetical protein
VTGVGLLSKRLSLATDEQQKEKASFVKYWQFKWKSLWTHLIILNQPAAISIGLSLIHSHLRKPRATRKSKSNFERDLYWIFGFFYWRN